MRALLEKGWQVSLDLQVVLIVYAAIEWTIKQVKEWLMIEYEYPIRIELQALS